MLVESLSEPRARSACRISGLLDHGLTYFAITSFLPVQPVEVRLCYAAIALLLHVFLPNRTDYAPATAGA